MQQRIGDRRSKPRFEVVGDLWGSVDVSATLKVLNLGRGGALLESPVPLKPESMHSIVAATEAESHRFTIRVRHSTGSQDARRRRFLVGVEFLDVSPALGEFLVRQIGNGSVSAEA